MERSSEPSKQENTKLNFHQPSLSHLSWVAEKLAQSGPALIIWYLLLYCVGSIGTIVAAAPGTYPHLMGRHRYTHNHTSLASSLVKIFSPKNILVAANYVTLALFDGRSGRRCIVRNSGQKMMTLSTGGWDVIDRSWARCPALCLRGQWSHPFRWFLKDFPLLTR